MHSGEWQICLFLCTAYRNVMGKELPVRDKTFVESIIPQKKPFVMVDALLQWQDTELQSAFTVPGDHIFVENGIFQAAGILEHQAQSVALHTGYDYFLKNEAPPVGYIGAVKRYEVTALPAAGDTLETHVHILSEMMGVTLVKTTTLLNGSEIASSEMKTVIK